MTSFPPCHGSGAVVLLYLLVPGLPTRKGWSILTRSGKESMSLSGESRPTRSGKGLMSLSEGSRLKNRSGKEPMLLPEEPASLPLCVLAPTDSRKGHVLLSWLSKPAYRRSPSCDRVPIHRTLALVEVGQGGGQIGNLCSVGRGSAEVHQMPRPIEIGIIFRRQHFEGRVMVAARSGQDKLQDKRRARHYYFVSKLRISRSTL